MVHGFGYRAEKSKVRSMVLVETYFKECLKTIDMKQKLKHFEEGINSFLDKNVKQSDKIRVMLCLNTSSIKLASLLQV